MAAMLYAQINFLFISPGRHYRGWAGQGATGLPRPHLVADSPLKTALLPHQGFTSRHTPSLLRLLQTLPIFTNLSHSFGVLLVHDLSLS